MREEIIKEIIRLNKDSVECITNESTDEEVLEFIYNEIVTGNRENKNLNLIQCLQYILYLKRNKIKLEIVNEYIKKLLDIEGISYQIINSEKEDLNIIFNNDEEIRIVLENLINYFENQIYSFDSTFYDYEICIHDLCKYYNVFGKLFDLEEKFLNLLRYSISRSGEVGDFGYAYGGLKQVKDNIKFLDKEMIIKVLDLFQGYSIQNKVTIKQILTIINYSDFDEEEAKILKFFYIDAKNLEELFEELIKDKIRESKIFDFNNYVSIKQKQEEIKENSIVKTFMHRINKNNSKNSFKLLIKSSKFSRKDFIIEIDNQVDVKIVSIIFRNDIEIIQIVDDDDEILNLPYYFNNSCSKIDYRSDECKKLGRIIEDKLKNMDRYEINNSNSIIGDKNKKKYEKVESEFNMEDLDQLIEELNFSRVTEQCLKDAKILISNSGAANAVDRIHTALHGYLITICSDYELSVSKNADIRELLKTIAEDLLEVKNGNSGQLINRIFNSIMSIEHQYNEIRNKSSLAHPNNLLDEAEARLVIDSGLVILKYINCKLNQIKNE